MPSKVISKEKLMPPRRSIAGWFSINIESFSSTVRRESRLSALFSGESEGSWNGYSYSPVPIQDARTHIDKITNSIFFSLY